MMWSAIGRGGGRYAKSRPRAEETESIKFTVVTSEFLKVGAWNGLKKLTGIGAFTHRRIPCECDIPE